MAKHLSVQKRIKKVARHFTECNYSFANWEQLNDLLDNIEDGKPTICYILPPDGKFSVRRGATSFIDKPTTLIAFIQSTKLDFDGEDNDAIIERMKLLAQMFIKEINRSELFEMIDDVDITYKVPYDTTDDCVTGVLVELPIVETTFVSCVMPDEFGYVEDVEEPEDGEEEQE